jgi:sugar (pentulose or hexulose) kinase
MNKTFIGIDLGTTFLKGAVLDLDTMRLGHAERLPFPDFIPNLPLTRREVEPAAVVAAVRDLVRRLLPHAPHCAGLVMCSQMHGLVLTDDHGQPLSTAITWQDQRALEPDPSGQGSVYDVMAQRVTPRDREDLGNDLRASRPLVDLYMQAQQARRAGNAPWPAGAIPASLPNFVLANLCGCAPSSDLTNAAAHAALNCETGDWHHDLIARLGLDDLRWPALRPFGAVAGTFELDGHTLPCCTPVGDHQCAVLGTLLRPDELSINVSTGSQVGILAPDFARSLDYETRPYFGADFGGRFLKAVIHIPAGRALNALMKLLCELAEAQGLTVPDPWAYIEHAASSASADDASLRVNLAFFPSSCGDAGSIENIHEDQLTVGHLFRAAFQNMAGNYHACAQRLAPDTTTRRLVFAGGLVQKMPPLRDTILQQFHTPYRFPPTSEDTLMGLLLLASVWSGHHSSYAQAASAISL